ncbi:MAG: sterol desaturase family protein [Pseudomonadota bacterium]
MDVERILVAVFLVLVICELLWSKRLGRKVYSAGDTLANFSVAVVGALLKPLALAWTYTFLTFVEPYQLFRLEASALNIVGTFILVEFAYYWYHRMLHEVPAMWTLHHTHHSSPWFNFTTAVRLNWISKFVSPLYFMPLTLLGFSPLWIALSLGLGLLYQLFLHTESLPKLGWFEGKLLNTPSAHRVHHGSNSAYIDKNYGGALIIWDRLFGTYQPETEPVRYGVTTGFMGHNPLAIQLQPLFRLLRGELRRERQLAEQREPATVNTRDAGEPA